MASSNSVWFVRLIEWTSLVVKGFAGALVGLIVAALMSLGLDGQWAIVGATVIAIILTVALLGIWDRLFAVSPEKLFASAQRRNPDELHPAVHRNGRMAFALGAIVALCVSLFLPAADILEYLYR